MASIWTAAVKRAGTHFMQDVSYHSNRNLNKPTEFIFSVTSRCTLRCRMCDFWKSDISYKEELSTDQWKQIISDIRDWVGPFYAKFTGGEPFLHKGLLEIIKFAKSRDVYTNIITSGRYLVPEVRKRVLESGLDSLTLSLDSIRPEVHNQIRGVEDVYQRVMDAVRFFKGRLPIGISTVIFQQNLDDLVPLVEWVNREGLNSISLQPVDENFASAENDPDWHETTDHFVKDKVKLDEKIDEVIRLKEAGAPVGNPVYHLNMIKNYFRDPTSVRENDKCMVGQTNFYIGSKGEVKMCLLWDEFDNYFNYNSPAEIWGSETAMKSRHEVKDCKEKCMLSCHRKRTLGEQATKFISFVRGGRLRASSPIG